jgi:hypothetical protein
MGTEEEVFVVRIAVIIVAHISPAKLLRCLLRCLGDLFLLSCYGSLLHGERLRPASGQRARLYGGGTVDGNRRFLCRLGIGFIIESCEVGKDVQSHNRILVYPTAEGGLWLGKAILIRDKLGCPRGTSLASATLLLGGGGGASAGGVTEVPAVLALGVGELGTVLHFVTLFLAKATADGLAGAWEVLRGACVRRHGVV